MFNIYFNAHRDVEELDKLIKYLTKNALAKSLVLLGFSTGCQDAILFMKDGKRKRAVEGIILQGPVSDRDYMSTLEGYPEYLRHAQEMIAAGTTSPSPQDTVTTHKPQHHTYSLTLTRVHPRSHSFSLMLTHTHAHTLTLAHTNTHSPLLTLTLTSGKGKEIMPRKCDDIAPITAERYASLGGRMTEDDMFSFDLTPEELTHKMGHIRTEKVASLIAYSMADEYVPPHVDKNVLIERLRVALGGCEEDEKLTDVLRIEDANHYLSQPAEACNAFINGVIKWIKKHF